MTPYEVPALLAFLIWTFRDINCTLTNYCIYMIYNVIADIIVILHFIWIMFMIIGFIFTVCGFLWKKFFEWALFRTVHLCGIVYVTLLALLGEYCPLTIFENALRTSYDPTLTYPGSFISHYIEHLVYPDVHPLYIIIPTIGIAVFTLIMYIIKPPSMIRKLFKD